jgi:hypothetical protein
MIVTLIDPFYLCVCIMHTFVFLIVFTQVFLCMRSFDIIFFFLTLTIQSKDGDKFDESIRTDLLKLRLMELM